MNGERKTTFNCIYTKVVVQWLNQAVCLVDSEVLLNRHLRLAAKRVFNLNRILKSNSYKPERNEPCFCGSVKKNKKLLWLVANYLKVNYF